MTELKPFLEDMLSMSTGTDGRTLQIHFSRPVTKEDRQAIADAHNAIVRGQLTPSPQPNVAGCQDISTAPANTDVLVWWPTVKLDDDGDPTEEVVGGCWLISEKQGGYWIEPDCMNAIGDHMGDDHTYADKPSHWMPLPAALFTATTEGSTDV